MNIKNFSIYFITTGLIYSTTISASFCEKTLRPIDRYPLLKIKVHEWRENYIKKYGNKNKTPMNWQEVIRQNNSSEKLFNFLKNDSKSVIEKKDNYNPFNHVNYDCANHNELISLMVERKADINQEEKLFDVVPSCWQCESNIQHPCLLQKGGTNTNLNEHKKHRIHVNRSKVFCRDRHPRNKSHECSNAGQYRIYSIPLWNIIEKYQGDKLAALMKSFIEHKADIHTNNIIAEWWNCLSDDHHQISRKESLLFYAVCKSVNSKIIEMLIENHIDIQEQYCEHVTIDNQRFKIRDAFAFSLFDSHYYSQTTEIADDLINMMITKHKELLIKQPRLPLFIRWSGSETLISWVETCFKVDDALNKKRYITTTAMEKFVKYVCSSSHWNTEDQVKILNCLLSTILYQTVTRTLKPFCPKPIIRMIAEYSCTGWSEKLADEIQKMTTVKTYLRPDTTITLTLACTKYEYQKELCQFIRRYAY